MKSGKGKTDNRKLEMKILLGKEKKTTTAHYVSYSVVFGQTRPIAISRVLTLKN